MFNSNLPVTRKSGYTSVVKNLLSTALNMCINWDLDSKTLFILQENVHTHSFLLTHPFTHTPHTHEMASLYTTRPQIAYVAKSRCSDEKLLSRPLQDN